MAHGARGGVRVRRLGAGRAGEIRIGRFLRNPLVTLDEMVGTAFARTEAACAGRDVLAVQDTTSTRSSPKGGCGSFLHATIAVDAKSQPEQRQACGNSDLGGRRGTTAAPASAAR